MTTACEPPLDPPCPFLGRGIFVPKEDPAPGFQAGEKCSLQQTSYPVLEWGISTINGIGN